MLTASFDGSIRSSRLVDVDSVMRKHTALKMVALGGELADHAMQVIDLLPVLGELPLALRLVPLGGEHPVGVVDEVGPPPADQVGVEPVLSRSLGLSSRPLSGSPGPTLASSSAGHLFPLGMTASLSVPFSAHPMRGYFSEQTVVQFREARLVIAKTTTAARPPSPLSHSENSSHR